MPQLQSDQSRGFTAKIRRGESSFFGTIKRMVQAVVCFHIPAGGPMRYIFSGLYRLHVALRELAIWSARFFWYEPLFRSQCQSIGK